MVLTEDVFGVSSRPVLSYIERPSVDDRFVEALRSDKQIVVYGSSEQGKTALVSKHLPGDGHITVSVTPKTQVIDIYSSILRQLGIKMKTSEQSSNGSEISATVTTRFKALIPLFVSGEAGASGGASAKRNGTQDYEEVPFNLELPQDVSELIKRTGGKKVVLLENFHYLDDDKQRQLAFDLRTFQELGVQFVVLGVWREKNRLAQFNGDLLDRVLEVPVEPWKKSEFSQVAMKGAEKLNVDLASSIISLCADASFSSIGVFQELLKEVCLRSGVKEYQSVRIQIGDASVVGGVVEAKADEYASRHQRALEAIGAGNVSTIAKDGLPPLFLPYYLVKVVLDVGFDGLVSGMRRATIQEKIQQMHHRPNDVRPSDMSNLLYNLAKLQSNKNISPPIIDYDKNSQLLQVVDSTFYFFLKHADLAAVAEEIPNPLE